MKKLLTLFLIGVLCLSFVACGGGDTTAQEDATENTADLGELCIGTWKWDFENSEGNDWGVEDMELYKGGTGKGTNSLHTNGSYYPLVWEVKDDVLVVSFQADPLSVAFEIDGDTMISTDGKTIYIRQ